MKLKTRNSKYNASPTVRDGMRFDSRAEAEYYDELKFLVKAGQVLYFLRQVPFDLPGNTKYRVDFMEVWDDGETVFTDVKGMVTDEFKRTKKQVEALYPVEIQVLKRRKTKRKGVYFERTVV